MLRSLCFSLASLAIGPLASTLATDALADPPLVVVNAVPLDASTPDRDTLGKVRFRGGLVLSSEDPAFGGWSDILLEPDGSACLAIGDQGSWLSATLEYDSDGDLMNAIVTDMGPLKDTAGKALGDRKELADAEALAPGAEGGYLVAFERSHRIWLYSPDLNATAVEAAMPPAVNGLKKELANEGMEAMSRLADGRLVVFLEGDPATSVTLGFVEGTVTFKAIPYVREDAFQITGSAPLPDGGLLIVERFWSPETDSRVRLRRLTAAQVGPAVVTPAELLLELQAPLTVDNIEGVGVWQDPTGATRVLLLSDDNFNREHQRTLLLDFEILE